MKPIYPVFQNVSKHFSLSKVLSRAVWVTPAVAVEIQDDSWSCFVTVEA